MAEQFGILEDSRTGHAIRHELLDNIVITLCAVNCGADNWVEIDEFHKSNEDWFWRFSKLPHGIPSGHLWEGVQPCWIRNSFRLVHMDWVRSVSELAQGEVLAIDGMTRSGSHYRANSRGPLHMASAWAAERRMVLGQTRASVHANETTAIPEPLKVLELKGYLVTIDAMGFQKAIARQVVQGGADYLLALCSPSSTTRRPHRLS